MRWWPHFHHDGDWQVVGVWMYEQCRCGARRTTRAYSNLIGPSDFGWPQARDRHGRMMRSSGWVGEPEGGWPDPKDAPVMVPPKGPAAGGKRP